ncbi:hypothetical protein [Arsenicicoccus dermatophilus]|uniref:hypothetical protein n=1 Tax=Arsenicicoccus dermatophilus TaxID=1076331 RepID=UPI001F4D05FC|nr:hypothetical protein [Arsenicicoccus dermatophilus]MCH8614478.1 hypothetical protein [Arsenicicoccus dermatophilus]
MTVTTAALPLAAWLAQLVEDGRRELERPLTPAPLLDAIEPAWRAGYEQGWHDRARALADEDYRARLHALALSRHGDAWPLVPADQDQPSPGR